MGAGTSSGKSSLSAVEREQITKGIQNHTSAQTDSAIKTLEGHIEKEQHIIDNYDKYVQLGHITGKNDPWWQEHENTLAKLKAQMKFFQSERKRLGK